MLYVVVGILLLLLIVPIVTIVLFSFTNANYFSWPIEAFSAKWYLNFFNDPQWYNGLLRSLLISLFTVLLSLVLATMAAVAVKKLNFKFKKVFTGIMITPMLLPVILLSVSLYYTFAPIGIVDTIWGIVIGHSIIALPMAFITISTGLSQLDENQECAGMSLGSTPVGVFFKITLPSIKPALFSAAAFAFVASMDELVITMYMSGPSTKTLPIVMWETMRYNVSPLIAVASTLLIGAVVLLFATKNTIQHVNQRNQL